MAAGDVASATFWNAGSASAVSPANVSGGSLAAGEVASGSATSAELAAFVQLTGVGVCLAGSAAVEKQSAALLLKDNGAFDGVDLTDAESKHAFRLKGALDDYVDLMSTLGW